MRWVKSAAPCPAMIFGIQPWHAETSMTLKSRVKPNLQWQLDLETQVFILKMEPNFIAVPYAQALAEDPQQVALKQMIL